MVVAIGMDTATATASMATGAIGAIGAGAAGAIIIRTAIGAMAGASAGTKGGDLTLRALTTVTVRG